MFTFYFREDHGPGRSWVWDWEPGCGPPKKGKKPGSDLVLADYVRFWLDGSSLETSHCAILNRQACFCLKLLSWSRLDANQIWHVYWVDEHCSAGKDCACLCFCDRCSLHGGILESKIWILSVGGGGWGWGYILVWWLCHRRVRICSDTAVSYHFVVVVVFCFFVFCFFGHALFCPCSKQIKHNIN